MCKNEAKWQERTAASDGTSSNRNSMGSTDVEVSSQNINCQKKG